MKGIKITLKYSRTNTNLKTLRGYARDSLPLRPEGISLPYTQLCLCSRTLLKKEAVLLYIVALKNKKQQQQQ